MADAVIEARQGEQMESSAESTATSHDEEFSLDDINIDVEAIEEPEENAEDEE